MTSEKMRRYMREWHQKHPNYCKEYYQKHKNDERCPTIGQHVVKLSAEPLMPIETQYDKRCDRCGHNHFQTMGRYFKKCFCCHKTFSNKEFEALKDVMEVMKN